MKKILAVLICVLTIFSLFAVVAMADTTKIEDDYVKENDVVFAALNGIKPFTEKLRRITELEDTAYWLAEYADAYNIKYVSFNGKMSSTANYGYDNYVIAQKKTITELYDANSVDTEWINEFLAVKDVGKILTDAGVPYGISIHLRDYYAVGFTRRNHVANQFVVDDFLGLEADVSAESYDTNNFATVVRENGKEYIVFQLEAYPRQAVIEWFNTTIQKHLDKRAFVFTTSFADANGEMYTQYDPYLYNANTAPSLGNFTLNTNMRTEGNPFDGESIWKHAIAKYDNIVMIMSANAEPVSGIVTKKFKNNNGYEVVSVVTNLVQGYDAIGALPVLIKFSEENKTLDLRYAVPYYNTESGYIEESHVEIKLDSLAPLPEPDPMSLIPKVPYQYNGANKKYINGYAGNLFKPSANMTRAEASTIFARLLVGSTTIPDGYTTRFSDVLESDWFYNAIAYMDSHNFYISNTTDKYRPNDPITRAEFVELAYLASNLYATETIEFKDVDNTHPYYDAIIAAAASGLVNGYEDSTFRPDGKITRAEVVTVINRMLSLVATKDTVYKEKLESSFSDISGHWAEYQILMSANDNVHGKSFYDIDASIFKENASSISFENNLLKITINKKSGKVTEAIYLPTGENKLLTSATPWFSYLTTRQGSLISPNSVSLVDGRLKFTYRGGYEAYFIVKVYDNFFTFELDSDIPSDLGSIVFANINFDYVASYEDDSFRASGIAMTTTTDIPHAPGGYDKHFVSAIVSNNIPVTLMGAKLGIVFSTYETHRDILKEIMLEIDPEKGLVNKAGGPWALDNPELNEDYAITYGMYLNNMHETAKMAQEYDVEVLDLHQGGAFVQGDFNFTGARTPEEQKAGKFIDAKTFKERVTDVLREEYGIKLALHTYAAGIDDSARTILKNPKWQKQLITTDHKYTLRGDVSAFRTTFKTYEDASNYKVDADPMPYGATYKTSQYLIIDEEIIRVTQNKGTTSGFMSVQRGQLGTEAAPHKDGAEIRHLVCNVGVFQPIAGSELFWHIADLTAKAYNDGGFTMIYLDGQEQVGYWTPSDSHYYWYAEFTRRIVSQCNTPPILESSVMGARQWNAGGRGGACDAVHRSIKNHKEGHWETYGQNFPKSFYTMTLGWFSFDTDKGEQYHNTYNKTLFHDDMDYMGSVSIISNFSMVPLDVSVYNYGDDTTRLWDNYSYYGVYSRLRKGNYFADEVKEALRKGEYEWRLFEREDGSFAFREMYYVEHKINNMSGNNDVIGTASNPFSAHDPYIRIEQRYSTLSENEKLVIAFDETKEIKSLLGKHTFTAHDHTQYRAFKIRVYGNGSENGAILFSVRDASNYKRDDFFVPTSHTGWKEFILIDPDNIDYDLTKYGFNGINTFWSNWDSRGGSPNYAALNSVTIATSGNVAGVMIDDIKAYNIVDAPAKNPSVTIGSNTITFDAEIRSGEFIEYYPDSKKAYLHYYTQFYDEAGNWLKNEAHTKEISYTGSVTAPAGSFNFEYNGKSVSGAPLRARVKIGLQGQIVANPDSWVAPEIDMGNATLDIRIK